MSIHQRQHGSRYPRTLLHSFREGRARSLHAPQSPIPIPITMPWPLLSARARNRDPDDELASTGAASPDRRSSSLDISRLALSKQEQDTLPRSQLSGGDHPSSKQTRRSSFPRLALPSWRTSTTSVHSAVTSGGGEEGGLELQPGYATPYTATGLRGGFTVVSHSVSNTGSSESACGSGFTTTTTTSSSAGSGFSHSSGGSAFSRSHLSRSTVGYSEHEEEHENGTALGPSSPPNTRDVASHPSKIHSPSQRPLDSEFEDFSPDSIVPEEVARSEAQRSASGSRPGLLSSLDNGKDSETGPDRGDTKASTATKKNRSRGWFSLTASANPSSNQQDPVSSPTPEPALGSASTSTKSTTRKANEAALSSLAHPEPSPSASSPTPSSIWSRRTKAVNVPRPKLSSLPGVGSGGKARARGDSEVSMKDLRSNA